MPIAPIQRPDRYAWVDFAKGLCIVAVVTLWVARTMQGNELQGNAGWLGYFVAFARPFRMPDFFLISGLFLSRVIDRPWKSYLDTKVVHYLYFLVLWTAIIVPGTWLLGHDVPATWQQGLSELAFALYKPVAMLWFILMLPIYFVATRLVRGVPVWLVLPVAAALMVYPLQTGFVPLDWFGDYFVFFYAGHVFANRFFALADWSARARGRAIAAVLVWAVFNGALVKLGWSADHAVSLLLGFVGISAIVMISSLVSKQRWATWLNYLGKHSIVVYLGFYLPMLAVIPALQASRIGTSPNLVGTLALIASVGSAVALYWATRHTPLSFLFERPAWARLVKRPGEALSSPGQRLGST